MYLPEIIPYRFKTGRSEHHIKHDNYSKNNIGDEIGPGIVHVTEKEQ
jgi:hypothetical protein